MPMTTGRGIQKFAVMLCLLAAAGAVRGQGTPPLRRVLVLPPDRPEAALEKWVEAQREAAARKPKHGGLFALFAAPKPASPKAAPPHKGPAAKAEPVTEPTARQLQALSEAMLWDDLTQRLRTRLHLTVPTEAEVRAAQAAQHLPASGTASSESLRLLAETLNCEAVLVLHSREVEQRSSGPRALTLRGRAELVVIGGAEEAAPAAGGKGRRHRPAPSSSPAAFPFFGVASTGRAMFRAGYRRNAVQLVQEAAQQAAAVAAHTFWTGEVAPFALEGERLALLPVPAPLHADALLFTPEGRRIAPEAVRDLPADVTTRFQPDLAPLGGTALVGPEEARRVLKAEGIGVEALWRQDQPEIVRVQALGQRLDVAYILMAQVTQIELQTGVPDGEQTFSTREARAEAVGVLVRIADGAILWQDRATTTMTLHPDRAKRPISIDRQAVEDAEHFALTDLQRRFRAYRARYEN